ncbi:hypothetical protein JI435_424820 [Parastagonospora nodorum SN15]|uniref:Uncharacterized protein n=1 Tax=Phaeosphaeria nodorum (strain SN15 / ATCC MYA-4574 / FGSC 10173) TaxID=321614 RepID=A0A7U2IDD3_PHANO|nr:hypothetical protein JI435_424820 [Parastagonospora nodorum SN15]
MLTLNGLSDGTPVPSETMNLSLSAFSRPAAPSTTTLARKRSVHKLQQDPV